MTNPLLEQVLNNFAAEVVSRAKKNLVDEKKSRGDLYNTLKYDVRVEPNLFLVDFLMEPYGAFVDKGVRGKTSTYPETQAALSDFRYGSGTGPKGGLTKGIETWLNKKRFQWRDKKGKFLSYETMSFLIARSIYNKGIKATMFFTKPYEELIKGLDSEIENSFFLDVENAITLGTKK
jgi:hypothetical protein|tara:strand:+ start:52 stop:582 length:531 start_codon:yes stop_codon:yes gene_type:complete